MTLAQEFLACRVFTCVFLAWLAATGVIAFAVEKYREHRARAAEEVRCEAA